MTCDEYMEVISKVGPLKSKHIVKCNAIAKFNVKFKCGFRGTKKENNLCNKHFLFFKKRCEKIQKKSGFDFELQYQEINHHGKESA